MGNRVSEIRENSEPEQWHHVSGEKNPADDITRGLDIYEMGPASRWVNWSRISAQRSPRMAKIT